MTRRNIQPALLGLGIFGVKSSLLCCQDYFFSKLNSFFVKIPGGVADCHTQWEFCRPDLPDRVARGMLWPLDL